MSNTASEVDDLPLDPEYGEEEGEEEEEEVIEEEPSIYYSEDFISGPFLSDESTLPGNILEFEYPFLCPKDFTENKRIGILTTTSYSFGYDCKRYYNLTVADENTLIFASGNLINFFNVETKEFTFRRSAFGGGIGHITKNPNTDFPHIAIAENGTKPPIIIYDWPSLEIVCLLKNGAAKCFTHVNYSPDGMLLVSQAGEPDFLITIYNWTTSKILLRTKSNVHEVYRVMFSPDVPGQLTSCGLSHIKFWKMSETFTGLKLKGELGRFGKTEYCDIVGIYPMPDEKVVSGCSWGNILVWDEGLIKMEVCRKQREKCHDAPIMQFYYSNGDLWSVSMDGRVRIWYYDYIDQADPPDDDRFVQISPSYDFYTPGVMFMCIFKQNDDPEDSFYYAQDGNGGLWRIDLNINIRAVPKPSEQLYKCHAGAIADIAACPWGPYLASLGVDGRLQVYNYEYQKLLFIYQYPAKGSAMIWLPLKYQGSGDQLILAFDDGNLRVVVLTIPSNVDNIKVVTIQISKAHNRPITQITMNEPGTVLVSGGEDATIFVHQVFYQNHHHAVLNPIGYITVPGTVTCLSWHHEHEQVVLVGCIHGHVVQVEVPTESQHYTTITYLLKLEPKQQRFVTYKAQIRRDIRIREIEARKAIKIARKREEMEKIKAENPGLDIDEEVFLADSESEEELEPLHIPEIPNRVLWMKTTDDGTIWLSMAGYDAGYIYEYHIDQTTDIPYKFQIIYDGDDTEISSYVYNHNKRYFFLAMQNGAIRVVRVNPDDWRDLSDYWQLSMHDNHHGFIPKMCFSYNERYFFSCGRDGNIFSYKFYPENDDYTRGAFIKYPIFKEPLEVEDTDGYINLSLEEAIVKAEYDRQQRIANHNKRIVLQKIKALKERFDKLLKRNAKLPASQVIPRREFETDPRITTHLQEKLGADLALVNRKYAFDVEKSRLAMENLRRYFTDAVDLFPIVVKGFWREIYLKNLRQRRLAPEFAETVKTVEEKIIEADLKGRPPERPPVVREAPPPIERKDKQLEYFLIGLSPSTIQCKLGAKLTRLLHKYRMRKLKIEKRQEQWDAFNALKPVDGVNDPQDEVALLHAKETIGDFKLKSAPDYKVPKHLRETTMKKYKELLLTRLQQYNLRYDLNMRVFNKRKEKVELIAYLNEIKNEIEKIHEELPKENHKLPVDIPTMTDEDFPEKNLEVIVPELQKREPFRKPVVKPIKGDLLEQEVLVRGMLEKGVFRHIKIKSKINNFCTDKDSEWETEIRKFRTSRKLFEQQLLIRKMSHLIEKFDQSCIQLYNDRMKIVVKANFIDLHLLTLYEELVIIKEFEQVENQLQEKVHSRMEDLLDMQDLITSVDNRIEIHRREIEHLQETEKEIQQQFFIVASDNRFYDFLRRIFKKKYKPPKIHTDDSSSSSESSSSSDESEDDDEGSIDSRDFGIIKLDESVCPKGCDQALYDLTFELRSKRHGVELEIRDQKYQIEVLKKEIEIHYKKVKVIQNNLKISQDELEAFQREKQRKLNEIRCTIVLKLHQLQHLSNNEANSISDVLVFSQTKLSGLYRRVGELHNETLQQKVKHKVNITHLCRMRTDCQHMERKIEELKGRIVEVMKMKFGKEVDIDEIEEVQLKRMVFELRMSQIDIKNLYERELKLWRDKYGEKQIELAQTIKDNTARYDLLAVMAREKTELARLISHQAKRREHLDNVVDVAEVYKEDIKRLCDIVKNQVKELQLLREEIKRLSMKTPPPPKERLPPQELEVEEEEPDDLFQWPELGYKMEMVQKSYAPPSVAEEEEDETFSYSYTEHVEYQTHTTEVQIPKVFSEEAEDVAKTLILEMLEALESFHDMSRPIIQSLVEQILEDVMRRGSVAEIIDNLIALLPMEPTDQQHSIIETTAEQIFSLQETQSQSEFMTSAANILEEIINDAFQTAGAPYNIMAKIISQSVDQLPIDFLLTRDSIHTIISKVSEQLPQEEIDKEELIQTVLSTTSNRITEIQAVLEKILQTVFGTGIDYLYYIKH